MTKIPMIGIKLFDPDRLLQGEGEPFGPKSVCICIADKEVGHRDLVPGVNLYKTARPPPEEVSARIISGGTPVGTRRGPNPLTETSTATQLPE